MARRWREAVMARWLSGLLVRVTMGVFLVTAVVVGEQTARARRVAQESARLSGEQSALRRVATLVAQSVPPPVVFEAVTREVGLLCGADLARMERYERDGTVTGVAVWSRMPVELAVGTRFDLDGVSIARDVRQTGGPVRVDSFRQATGAIAREARAVPRRGRPRAGAADAGPPFRRSGGARVGPRRGCQSGSR